VAGTNPQVLPLQIPAAALPIIHHPVMHAADDDDAGATSDEDALRAKELKEMFFKFDAKKVGTDPKSKVVLYGTIFAECLPDDERDFQIKQHPKMEGGTCKNSVGFEIIDRNKDTLKCVKQMKKKKAKCGKDHPCIRLSEINGSTMKFDEDSGKVSVKLFYHDAEDDENYDKCENLAGKEITHRDQKAIDKEKKDKEDAEQRALVKKYQDQLKCTSSTEELEVARLANAALLSLGKIDDEMAARNEEKYLDAEKRLAKSEFDSLLKKAREHDADPEEVLEELIAAAQDHPEQADKIAIALKELALRITADNDATPEAWDKAEELIVRALSLKELADAKITKKTQKELEGSLKEIRIGRVASMARFGLYHNPYGFQKEWKNVVREVSKDVRKYCQRGMYAGRGIRIGAHRERYRRDRDYDDDFDDIFGGNRYMEDCSNAVQIQQGVMQLPEVARQSELQQYQLYNQIQGGAGRPGMEIPGQMFGNPYSMMGMNPMMGGMGGFPMGGMNMMNPMGGMGMGGFPMGGMGMGMGMGGFSMGGMGMPMGMNPMMGGGMFGGMGMMF
jgi:hypothetical protein